MTVCRPIHAQPRTAWLLVVLGLAALAPPSVRAAPPTSAQVNAMVERALKYLETQDDERLGGKCLIGLAYFKAGRPLSHPKVAAAQAACAIGLNDPGSLPDNCAYSLGLAIVFLLETDATKNRGLAERYVAELLKRQKPAGGWGYSIYETCDTSQTQYPALGLWLALNNGIDVPVAAIEKACGWLLRTQDPYGAWGYQGNDPGTFQRIAQNEIRPALAAAGLGSMYICADMLGLNEVEQTTEEEKQPAALRRVGEEQKPKRRRVVSRSLDHGLIRRALSDGNRWFAANFSLESANYTHYYLYALERYQSFRELSEKVLDPSPKWYNAVAELLQKTQDMEGFWEGGDTRAVATSFSVLVLLRSSQKTIGKVVGGDLGKGVLLGGMGLPANTANLSERDGKVIETPLAGTIDELLALIEKSNLPDLDQLAMSVQTLKLDSDITRRSGQIARLRALVTKGSFEARLVAVKALSRVRELDNVPILVFALTDPDQQIVREADKGLRFISRKFDGVGLPPEPKPQDVKAASSAWKSWYLSIRPSAEFLD